MAYAVLSDRSSAVAAALHELVEVMSEPVAPVVPHEPLSIMYTPAG
jgi:hypothetical protein